ncbi:ABC transporter permease [Alteromonas aestuariivivens]|uniref:ABC transporter permease n=1 Tax=Alteromonas aestuariivivens TaxID=1938339 RepID=A0A3D8M9S5_9ALTE|nr:ABC transporter permease [Alteromonas aestuariivivens]RDV26803.1 ABC transporter permease [Alteromonas aestuariivivens]
MIGHIAISSLINRRGSVALTLLSIIISVSMLLSVELIRNQVKDSFTRTVSGVDLIAGAPTGQLNLLLSTVFRLGNPAGGISWQSVEVLLQNPNVKWAIPLSLGDTHEGIRVVGTTNDYFRYFQYGNRQSLEWHKGQGFDQPFAAVLGADAAQRLGYTLGDTLFLSHGLASVSFHQHRSHPFVVSGILAKTGTPVDQAIYVTLQGLEQAHDAPVPSLSMRKPSDSQAKTAAEHDHEHHDDDGDRAHAEAEATGIEWEPEASPKQVTAVMLGLNNRVAALQLQHQINQYQPEALLAILPGVALAELWQLMGNFERLLLVISGLILVASLLGLVTMLLASMRERRQEIAILRTIGAGPGVILWLIQAEALLVSALGCMLAMLVVTLMMKLGEDFLSQEYGLFVTASLFQTPVLSVVTIVMAATWLCSLIPALAAYRQALHSGLTQR